MAQSTAPQGQSRWGADQPNKKWMIVLSVIVGVFVVLVGYDLISSRSALISGTSKSSTASASPVTS